MQAAPDRRTLVVANRTAATPLRLEEVRRRAGERPTAFVLLVLTPSLSVASHATGRSTKG